LPASVASVFSEAEDFEAALRPLGCASLLVTGRGAFRERLTQVTLHRLQLAAGEEELARIAFLVVPSGMFLIAFAAPGVSSPIWSGIELKTREIITVSPDERLHTRTDGPCSWCVMVLQAQGLLRYASALTGADFMIPRGIARWQVAPNAWRCLRDLYRAAIRTSESRPATVTDTEAAHGLEQQIIYALIECLSPNAMTEEPPTAIRHRDLLARFEELLTTGSPRLLAEICCELGVSERLLRECCKLHLGMSPTDYRRRCAMQRVYRELRRGNSQALTVAEVAKRNGFNALGRLSRNYRALYGELPSATLRSSQDIAWRKQRVTVL
jgi:AraC-like DNA-binding protein